MKHRSTNKQTNQPTNKTNNQKQPKKQKLGIATSPSSINQRNLSTKCKNAKQNQSQKKNTHMHLLKNRQFERKKKEKYYNNYNILREK